MQTPIKIADKDFKSVSAIKSLIPADSMVHTFLMYNGGVEVPLASDGRYVIAHTNKYAIYEFWTCLSLNTEQVKRTATHFDNIQDKNIFYLLQETLPNYPDPYLRSGIFFLLNKYSQSGYVSSGEFMPDSYNPRALSQLDKLPFQNLMVVYNKGDDFVKSMENITHRCDYVVVPVGDFSLNYLKNKEQEMTNLPYDRAFVDAHRMKEYIENTNRKVIYVFRFSESVLKFFKGQKFYFVDRWGRQIQSKENAAEVLIANF